MRIKIKIGLVFSGLILLAACNKEPSPYLAFVEEIEKASLLSNMKSINLNFTEGRQRVEFSPCGDSAALPKQSFPLQMESGWKIPKDFPMDKDSIQLYQNKISELENIFKGFSFSSRLLSANAVENCGQSLMLGFVPGEILVYSQNNMDNVIGFQYKRSVIKDGWDLYQLK